MVESEKCLCVQSSEYAKEPNEADTQNASKMFSGKKTVSRNNAAMRQFLFSTIEKYSLKVFGHNRMSLICILLSIALQLLKPNSVPRCCDRRKAILFHPILAEP